MSIYTENIKPLEDQGMTDEQVIASLQADTRHFRNIKATGSQDGSDLLHILASQFKVLRIGPDATWKGALIDYLYDEKNNVPDALIGGFEELLSNLQITNRNVFCGVDAETGYLVSAITSLVDGIVAQREGNEQGDVVAAVHAITGGPLWGGLTEAKVAEYRTEYQEQQRKNDVSAILAEIENDYINPSLVDGSSTGEQVRAAIKAGL